MVSYLFRLRACKCYGDMYSTQCFVKYKLNLCGNDSLERTYDGGDGGACKLSSTELTMVTL